MSARATRRAGEGTVEVLPSGRARYRLPLPDGSRATSRTFADEAEATAALVIERDLHARGAAAPALALGAWGASWLDRRRTANADTERGLWRLHVLGTDLAAVDLRELRARHLLAWAERELPRHRALVMGPGSKRVPGPDPISVQTQRLCWALVRRVLAAAVVEEAIAVNPARGLSPAWDEDTEDDAWTFLAEEEIAQLLRCEAIGAAARLHYGWAIGAGPRQRESWGLRWQHLDLRALRGTIRVSGDRRTTKGGKVRRFPLLPLAADALLRWAEIAPDTRPDALVWPARLRPPVPGGERWRSPGEMRSKGDDMGWADRSRGAQGVSHGHRTIAGIRASVTYHDLRHTCAAGLLRGYAILGVPGPWSLGEVCDFLGHADMRTTERYAHIAGGGLADRAASRGPAPAVHRQSMVLPISAPVADAALFPKQWVACSSHAAVTDERDAPPPAPPMDCRWTAEALAQQVLRLLSSGDPHAVRHVIELCAEALDSAAPAQADPRQRGVR